MLDPHKLNYFDRLNIREGEVMSFIVDGAATDFSLVLAWTDPPAAPNARRMLVNDLNLDCIVDGAVRLFGGDEAVPDSRNNVEKISFIPQGAHVQIFVRGARLQYGTMQPFALVAAAIADVNAPAMAATAVSTVCSTSMPPQPCVHSNIYSEKL